VKPTEITDWLEMVKKEAGEGCDRVSLECRRILDVPNDVALVAYFPDGRICSLILPVKG
jgi:hypothetical protein